MSFSRAVRCGGGIDNNSLWVEQVMITNTRKWVTVNKEELLEF
jgi:hypothetical protein